MKYAGIIYDDTAAAPGLSLSFYTQGCPIHCPGCHNQDMWDFEGGYEFNSEVRDKVIAKLNENGVLRNLCIIGGEPLCEQNAHMTELLCGFARVEYPDIKIYIWTGYTLEELCEREANVDTPDGKRIHNILECVDVLIANPFDISKRDITLELRGSSNQEIYKFVTEEEFADGGKTYGFERANTIYPYVIKGEKFQGE
jgi:anaerobic ribonucleoside-triphosphate reductase activating protein